jgi:uncharacterized protein (TIRG00374 family)
MQPHPERSYGGPVRDRELIGDRVERAIEEHADAERELQRGEAEQPPRTSLTRTVVWLAITGVSLYLVAPSIISVAGSWRDLDELAPGWLAAMALLQAATLASIWLLQRIAVHTTRWRPVIASQLAGNALAKIAPGGGAVGAALQYRMLVESGIERARAVAGLTAVNLLTFAFVLALPLLALPALLRGSVDPGLLQAGAASLVLFAALAGLAALMLTRDGPLVWVGRTVQRVRNRLRRKSEPLTGLPDRLLRERARILGVLGPEWKGALLATAGRWAFDYGSLLAALAAVGANARPGLVLLAFCVAQMLAQIPVTPGGLGFVEAGLTATLSLAGVPAGQAVLATFAYRLFSYWLPLPLGLVGLALQRGSPPGSRSRAPKPT